MSSYIGYTKDVSSVNESRHLFTASAGQTAFSVFYSVGFIDVFVNGVKLRPVDDFTALDGTNVILIEALTLGDEVEIIGRASSTMFDVYSKPQVDAKMVSYGIAIGSGNAMSVAMSPPIAGLVNGAEIKIRVPSANTVTSPSITFSDLGIAKGITKLGNQPLLPGDLVANQEITLRFNATSNKLELVNAAPILPQFQSQLTSSGYQKLPSGLIIQWGTLPSVPANSSVVITYPIPFPSGVFSTNPSSGSSVAGTPGVAWQHIDLTSFRVYNQSTTLASGIGTYMSIGI